VITQHVVQPIKRTQAKPAKITLLSRLKDYASALIKPLRFSSPTTPKPPSIEWTPQSCGTHLVQAPAKLSEDFRRRLHEELLKAPQDYWTDKQS